MRWPWVGRLALDQAEKRAEDAWDQIRTLRAQVEWQQGNIASLQESLTRVVRHQSGMTETPRPERKALEPMPKSIHDYINSFANPSVKKNMRDQLYKRHGRGTPWSVMEAEIPQKEEHEQTSES